MGITYFKVVVRDGLSKKQLLESAKTEMKKMQTSKMCEKSIWAETNVRIEIRKLRSLLVKATDKVVKCLRIYDIFIAPTFLESLLLMFYISICHLF